MSGVIYLDLKKVFDTVNHAILLKKLNAFGVDSDSLLWFKSYLRNRTQRTAVAESIFKSTPSYDWSSAEINSRSIVVSCIHK